MRSFFNTFKSPKLNCLNFFKYNLEKNFYLNITNKNYNYKKIFYSLCFNFWQHRTTERSFTMFLILFLRTKSKTLFLSQTRFISRPVFSEAFTTRRRRTQNTKKMRISLMFVGPLMICPNMWQVEVFRSRITELNWFFKAKIWNYLEKSLDQICSTQKKEYF